MLHFDRGAGRMDELAALPREWFHYAQICDAPAHYSTDATALKYVAREARLYLGEGGINVRSILARLPRIPYSIELPNTQRLAQLGPDEFARRCLVTAKRHLGAPDVKAAV
jgi:sugar phosphate isomerase/epimerase